ncbi:gamma-glutamyl-gamma-aminobutyrate hydrolase family protein [Halomonas nitroreducens]|uniref:gamma-glutamyl-gamma-aminobutyrate hydrolase n=1 Tax=Halomonas nitroreducens TaxID=447425 RepID=A0A3S0K2E0_9GAMM|nr:gamma-glutamyl-gamma-aminobutyrate hydrolase family protein [Halomonas nitroreducens]RTR02324.1 gamma-glutamyl-gamma-aminobutyrate hydrolase family protein [Halomonas nitroreducens]
MQTRPLVGVIACRREVEGHPAHMVTDKYLSALREYGLEPVVLPVWEPVEGASIQSLLARLDGLVLTGSYTNVAPQRYGAERAPENTRGDRDRDAAAMAWVPVALDLGVPLLGICRGFQELNVAFGGSLYQAVQNQPGKLDHREPAGDREAQYAPCHDLEILPGGRLAALYPERQARVNSLHQQGIERLGEGLIAEAVAPDGLIEAISVTDAPAFTLAVQWHPEWRPRQHPLYDVLFTAFAQACAQHQASASPLPA